MRSIPDGRKLEQKGGEGGEEPKPADPIFKCFRPEPGKYEEGFLIEKPLFVLSDSFERMRWARSHRPLDWACADRNFPTFPTFLFKLDRMDRVFPPVLFGLPVSVVASATGDRRGVVPQKQRDEDGLSALRGGAPASL